MMEIFNTINTVVWSMLGVAVIVAAMCSLYYHIRMRIIFKEIKDFLDGKGEA